jgi:hypothetical protein
MAKNDGRGSGDRHEINRRTALQVIGGAAAGAAIVPRLALATPAPSSRYALVADRSLRQPLLASLRAAVSGAATPSLVFQTIRIEDMVYLGFEFYNAKGVVKDGQTYIVPTDTSQPT